MELSIAIRAVIATMRQRPADLFPFYMLGLAIPSIIRVISFIGGIALVAYLVMSGRVALVREELALIDTEPPDPEADPDAFVEWVESLEPLIEAVVSLPSVGIVLLTIIASIAAFLILGAAVSAGQMATCVARLRQERGLVAGIAGFRQYWAPFLGIYLLELVLWLLVTTATVVAIAVAFAISPILAIFVGIFALLFWAVVVVTIRAVFAFAPAAIVIDEVSVLGSLRSSLGFIRAEFMNAASYYVISVGVLMGFAGLSSSAAALGAPSVSAIVSFLLIAPALDLLKTVLFGDYRGAVRPPADPDIGVIVQTRRGIRRGLSETGGFVRETRGLHGLSLVSMAIGATMGWVAAGALVGVIDTSIRVRTAGVFPPIEAINFFGNNWAVAMSTAFSGVAAGIPSAVGLWFNGFVIGGVARLEVVILELVVFVIPHGIFEIPAILIAGALGFYLGIATWKAWRGSMDRRAFAATLERGFWVVIGMGILLAIAGFIEGFISPFLFRLLL